MTVLEGGLDTDSDMYFLLIVSLFWRTTTWLYCCSDLYWLFPALTQGSRGPEGKGEAGMGSGEKDPTPEGSLSPVRGGCFGSLAQHHHVRAGNCQ